LKAYQNIPWNIRILTELTRTLENFLWNSLWARGYCHAPFWLDRLFCAEGRTTPPPNLGFFDRVSPLFCEVLLLRGLTFWVPTHASQLLVTRPGSVSTFLSYHARGFPLVMALSWVVSVPGSPSSGVGTSRVRFSPTGTRTCGLEATFLFPLSLFWTVEARSLLAMS